MKSSSIVSPGEGHTQVKKPASVNLLLMLVLLVTALHLARFVQSLARWSFLNEILQFSPLYLVFNGALWGLVGLVLTWAIWTRKAWLPGVLRIAVSLYTLGYWFERIILAGTSLRNINWTFAAGINLVVILFVFWQLQRKAVMNTFGVNYDK